MTREEARARAGGGESVMVLHQDELCINDGTGSHWIVCLEEILEHAEYGTCSVAQRNSRDY